MQRAIQLKPTYADAHYNLAHALTRSGQPAAAQIQFRAAIAVRPDWVPALTDLAWLQATTADVSTRDPTTAIQLALRAVDLSGHQDGAALMSSPQHTRRPADSMRRKKPPKLEW